MDPQVQHRDAWVTAPDIALSGIGPGTPVMTMIGARPVETLAPGDRLVTRAGVRVLRGLSVTEARVAMVGFPAGTLGHDRPQEALLLAPGQGVLIRDWRAKALFGQTQAVVPAARLVDGRLVQRMAEASVRLFTLHLDGHQIVQAGGLDLAFAPADVTA